VRSAITSCFLIWVSFREAYLVRLSRSSVSIVVLRREAEIFALLFPYRKIYFIECTFGIFSGCNKIFRAMRLANNDTLVPLGTFDIGHIEEGGSSGRQGYVVLPNVNFFVRHGGPIAGQGISF